MTFDLGGPNYGLEMDGLDCSIYSLDNVTLAKYLQIYIN